MEDSFRVRVDKAFGSLISAATQPAAPSSSSSSSAPSSTSVGSSLWCLTDEEIDRNESNRNKKHLLHDDDDDDDDNIGLNSVSSRKREIDRHFRMEKDLDDLRDDDDDEDEDESRVSSKVKPDDYGDEEWEIKSGIGHDCTLDYEEEEDEYDTVAVGKRNKVELEDRLYMKDVNDYDVLVDSGNTVPDSFMRDPRANHAAARLRLKEDAESAKKMDSLQVAEKGSLSSSSAGVDGNLKSILKRKDGPDSNASGTSLEEPKLQDKQLGSVKPQKRVRFDPDCKDGHHDEESQVMKDEGMKTDAVDGAAVYRLPPDYPSGIPDYMRNPTKYTRYDFDSSSDVDDKSNSQAYMEFLEMVKKSKSNSAELQPDDAGGDLPKSLVFVPKKKTGEVRTRASLDEASEDESDAKFMPRKDLPVGIAVSDIQDIETSPMEEDEPSNPSPDTKSGYNRTGRQYRTRARLEADEAI